METIKTVEEFYAAFAKIAENDPDFTENTAAIGEPEALKKFFADAGYEVDDAVVDEMMKAGEGEELTEDDLDTVSGGLSVIIKYGLKALGWSWKFAVKQFGSEKRAAKAIAYYWTHGCKLGPYAN